MKFIGSMDDVNVYLGDTQTDANMVYVRGLHVNAAISFQALAAVNGMVAKAIMLEVAATEEPPKAG